MARVAGIQIEKDKKGKPAFARINLKKHAEFIPQLAKAGALNNDNIPEGYMTGEEFKKQCINEVKKLFEKHEKGLLQLSRKK